MCISVDVGLAISEGKVLQTRGSEVIIEKWTAFDLLLQIQLSCYISLTFIL